VVDSIGKNLVVPPNTPETLPLAARIDSFTRNTALLYDQIVPLRVAAGQFVNHPGLIERGLVMQNSLRDAAFRVFEHEFSLLSEAAKEGLADAIGVALSLDAWVVLRRQYRLSFERALAAWRLTLEALLAHPVLQDAAA
jgi:hypothetical protein